MINDKNCEVTRLTEEQLKQVTGGTASSATKELCSNCRKYYATKSGFVVRDDSSGLIHQVNFKGNLCDACAEKKLQFYLNQGNTLVQWLAAK